MHYRLPLSLFAIAMLAVTSMNSYAAGNLFFGPKAYSVNLDNPNYDDAINGGLLIGAKFIASSTHSFALEAEISQTVVKGDVGSEEWELDTFGIFAAFRAGGNLYFKGKLGMVDREIRSTSGSLNDDNEMAIGLGFGFQDGMMRMLEIEYTQIDDNRYSPEIRMLSIGYYF